jgi:hypothetical protein
MQYIVYVLHTIFCMLIMYKINTLGNIDKYVAAVINMGTLIGLTLLLISNFTVLYLVILMIPVWLEISSYLAFKIKN